ncbi:low affinity immunoglobulin gamma Fc region receptor II-like [Scomber scombrus]|uniref:low affinity immunoglobulin gamma Fc region receptor II-like n=1 Tax=Scomber scombrus TaxID=13677 RepID=UPI002DD9F356|nr:low affinity immunoglobulin gamma Fc region receptor II-like [Scomber scombrus]
MEVTALCIRLDLGFPQVVPNRQQHFKHEPIIVSCEGLAGLNGWRVMRKIKESPIICASNWQKSTGPCEISTAYPHADSGEYWCEIGGKKSNTINITVTAGSVILESPVLPVVEGKNMTLRCRNKKTFNLTAKFYKDDNFMGSSSTGEMSFHNLSKSNAGYYKCSISDFGESSASWVTVTAHEELQKSPLVSLLLFIGVTVGLVAVLLLVGLLRCKKHQTIITATGSPTSPSSVESSSFPQTVYQQAEPAATQAQPAATQAQPAATQAQPAATQAIYAFITRPMRDTGPGLPSCSATQVPTAATNPKEDCYYQTVNYVNV